MPELRLALLGDVGADVELIHHRPDDVEVARVDGAIDEDLADAVGREGDLEGVLSDLVLRVLLDRLADPLAG